MPRKNIRSASHSHSVSVKDFLQRYQNYLSQNGLKLTKQRKIIISEFLQAGGHLNAEDLFHLVKKKASGIGLASVYRTINSLVQAGLMVERRFLDKSSVYEVLEPGAHHDHLICMRCRKIFEFENDRIEALQEEVAKSMGFKLSDHKLELYGYCQKNNCPNL